MLQVASANGTVGTSFNLTIPNANLWSPWSPYLYDLDIKILPASPNVTAFGVTNYQAQVSAGLALLGWQLSSSCA